ncbi:MAG: carotenoid 1,2-hydratase [Betaproteobacteria bacterium]|nr:carotenoid 1,2-hydratase [Betaproteobacteria bacterium]
MNPGRRAWLARLAGLAGLAGLLGVPTSAGAAPERAGTAEGETAVRRGRALIFPRDHGAHLTARIEWWYVTGWLGGDDGDAPTSTPTPTHGFQLTFFRSRVRGADGPSAPPLGRFDPRHLLFAHAAVTDLAAGRHLHAQRLARWNGDPASGPDRAAIDDGHVRVGRWQLARDAASPWQASRWQARLAADSFKLAATLQAAAPPLLQGDAGFSRKGPEEHQASHYYSLPQLDTRLALELNGRPLALAGRAWLDHEWSDELMHPQAVGWDWIGINLFDGSALTAFRLRRADGSTLWAGGSLRAVPAADGAAAGASSTRAFAPNEVAFEPGRRWRSAATNAVYPVTWQVQTPAGRHQLRALLDAQELDSRASTGAVYWEGLAELLDEQGRRIGLGYLEMTGYAARLRLG